MKRFLFFFILMAVIVFQLTFMFPDKVGQFETPANMEESAESEVRAKEEQTLRGGYLVESESKERTWEIWSEVARKTSDQSFWDMQKVKVHFYGSENVLYEVHGDLGRVEPGENIVKIWKNVKVVTSHGYEMSTDELNYLANEKKLYTDGEVGILGPKEKTGRLKLEGVGLDSDLAKNEIVLRSKVKASREMKFRRTMRITSRRAIFKENSRSAVFEKNVKIKVNRMTITGPKADFRYRNGVLDTLHVTGGVKVVDRDKWGTAGRATVFFNEDKYVFDDQPNVVQGGDQLHGEQITLLEGGEVVQVTKAKARYFRKQKR